MKKRIFFILAMTLIAMCANAVPARLGYWKKLKLADGTIVKAQLKGDENLHYWESADGMMYDLCDNSETYEMTTAEKLQKKARIHRDNKRAAMPRKALGSKRKTKYQGMKKGLIILAEFSDNSFIEGHDTTTFRKIVNERDYSESPFRGSVKDYFLAQSNGQFELDFDVVGPVKLSRNSRYYAGNDGTQRSTEMIEEACTLAEDLVNFADYDWDGDGEVEQVYVLYAGKGQHDGGGSSTVWPHEWSFTESNLNKVMVDSVYVDVYSCGNELNGSGQLAGIGILCHEYTHCFGIMDSYDTARSVNFGMYNWDLMDYGCYNENGYLPCGYTSYQKWHCGWQEPIELKSDTTITDMKALSENGETYVIYNDNCDDEYYLLENRQFTSWDAGLSGEGLLIIHVDYDELIWKNNVINSTGSFKTYSGYTDNFTNDHQRMTLIHADNSEGQWFSDLYGDTYPYQENDSLTTLSTPAAMVYNTNTDGTNNMNKGLRNIMQNDDGTISFDFALLPSAVEPDSCLFAETFDKSCGTGGNDGQFSGTVAISTFLADNAGWTSVKKYGGDKCVKFGNASNIGEATSPSFEIDGSAILSFNAAAYGNDGDSLEVYLGENLLDTVVMSNTGWTTYNFDIYGEGTTYLRFVPMKRFFLDEVYVKKVEDTGIVETTVRKQHTNPNIYGLDGRCLTTDWNSLPHGIYIYQGKKIVK